jgi:hypothetical protein
MAWLGYLLLALLALIVVSLFVEVWRFKQDMRRNGWDR